MKFFALTKRYYSWKDHYKIWKHFHVWSLKVSHFPCKGEKIVIFMIKKIYIGKHIQANGADNVFVDHLLSRTNKLLSEIIWYFFVLWTFYFVSNIILIHLFDLVEVICVQTISYTKLFKTAKHPEMLSQHFLTPGQA